MILRNMALRQWWSVQSPTARSIFWIGKETMILEGAQAVSYLNSIVTKLPSRIIQEDSSITQLIFTSMKPTVKLSVILVLYIPTRRWTAKFSIFSRIVVTQLKSSVWRASYHKYSHSSDRLLVRTNNGYVSICLYYFYHYSVPSFPLVVYRCRRNYTSSSGFGPWWKFQKLVFVYS